MRASLFLGSLPVLLLALGCLGEPTRVKVDRSIQSLENDPLVDPDRVIAEVNGQPITQADYYRRVLEKFGTFTILSGMIKEELFLQEANRRGITLEPGEVDKKLDELMRQEEEGAGGRTQLKEIYLEQGLTLDDVRRDYARDLKYHLLFGKVVKAMRIIDGPALRKYYQETYAKKRFRVRHIPYRYPLEGLQESELAQRKIEALQKAKSASKRIREGADFAEIARQESEDITREMGGDLGYIAEDQPMDPVMKEALLKLKPLDVSDPVENNLLGAYHIVQVTEILMPQPYEECRELMRRELEEREPDPEEIQDALQRLRSQGSVRIFGIEQQDPGWKSSLWREGGR